MDDLSDEPQKAAEDIINQAKSGFRQEAINRIIQILTSYHKLQKDFEELFEQQQTEYEVSFDGYLAWRIIEGKKEGPYCALCYNGYKGLFRLVERKGTGGWWECPKCQKHVQESSYQEEEEELSTARDRIQIYLKEKLKRLTFDVVRKKIDKSYTDPFLEKLIKKYPKVFRSCKIKTGQGNKRGITLTQEAAQDT